MAKRNPTRQSTYLADRSLPMAIMNVYIKYTNDGRPKLPKSPISDNSFLMCMGSFRLGPNPFNSCQTNTCLAKCALVFKGGEKIKPLSYTSMAFTFNMPDPSLPYSFVEEELEAHAH